MTRWCVNVNAVFHFWEVAGGFVQRRCVSTVCIDITRDHRADGRVKTNPVEFIRRFLSAE